MKISTSIPISYIWESPRAIYDSFFIIVCCLVTAPRVDRICPVLSNLQSTFSAGHETTSVSMSWTLHELSRHPEIQEKIREETDLEIKDGENLTWGKLEKLKYLGSVIKESLRLHPPAVTVLRNCKQDVCLGGYDVPSGTHVCLGICMMHRLPQYWTNPLEFNPDRFFDNSKYMQLPSLCMIIMILEIPLIRNTLQVTR